MAKYKLKEGKSLDDFPQSGGIGRSIFVALKNNGEFIYSSGQQEIPSECLKLLQEDKPEVVKENPAPKVAKNKGEK